MARLGKNANRSIAQMLSNKINRLLNTIVDELRSGQTPSKEEIDELDRLTKAQEFIKAQAAKSTRTVEIVGLCFALVILVILNLCRLHSTAVDVEVRATGCNFTLEESGKTILIPGEAGQILILKSATIQGADSVEPPDRNVNGAVDLRPNEIFQAGSPEPGKIGKIISLQAITLSKGVPYSISSGVEYAGNSRGLTLTTAGEIPVTAQFGEQISVPSVKGAPSTMAANQIIVKGKRLTFSLFSADDTHDLVVSRDVHISSIRFENSGASTILGGAAYIRGRARTTLSPGDILNLASKNSPILLRQMILKKGEITALLSATQATTISLGDMSLMPTMFQYARYLWPNEMYAALSAVAALWIAMRKWWKGTD